MDAGRRTRDRVFTTAAERFGKLATQVAIELDRRQAIARADRLVPLSNR
ncbi:hypothetical protein [Leptothrix discophora]|uniref:Uncharacterized protein n=1 Tax=Leptothrix discophora TaxID=89 RepID=A0ABT9G1V9_LEPDI|nr:hypothetical protein [Leptothrix discophora]MDP4300405.1 hypothetical protein [Leptothrix discophora]